MFNALSCTCNLYLANFETINRIKREREKERESKLNFNGLVFECLSDNLNVNDDDDDD
jgi:hypothetical protein